jgi:ferrous-iron efflux pump FieF
MDRELPEEEQQLIKSTILAHEQVLGVHDLRTRQSGSTRFIQFHLELDDSLTLYAAHEMSEQVELAVEQLFDNADILIHQDPQSVVPLEKHQALSID